jgi:hypothetical protein
VLPEQFKGGCARYHRCILRPALQGRLCVRATSPPNGVLSSSSAHSASGWRRANAWVADRAGGGDELPHPNLIAAGAIDTMLL